MDNIRELTARLAAGDGDPLRDAHAIYWEATRASAWNNDECVDVADLGAEFLQVGEALEQFQDDAASCMKYEALIRQAAQAVQAGSPLPDWIP